LQTIFANDGACMRDDARAGLLAGVA